MSPVERNSGHTLTAVLVAGAGVVVAMGAAFGVALLGSRGDVDIRLGDDEARIGDLEDIAEEIEENGPAFFQDPAGGERDVVIQHLPDGGEDEWLAIAARPADAARGCQIVWQSDEEVFLLLDPTEGEDGAVTDSCDGRSYPADGGELPTYEVTIRDGTLYVDPRSDERPDPEEDGDEAGDGHGDESANGDSR